MSPERLCQQILIANPWTESKKPNGRVMANNEGAERDCKPIGKTISTHWRPCRSQWLNHQRVYMVHGWMSALIKAKQSRGRMGGCRGQNEKGDIILNVNT